MIRSCGFEFGAALRFKACQKCGVLCPLFIWVGVARCKDLLCVAHMHSGTSAVVPDMCTAFLLVAEYRR